MPKSLTTRLETDAKLIRALMLLRVTLWDWHGGTARLRDGSVTQLNSRLEVEALDAALKVLGIDEAGPPLP